jgi:hypothetical protein
MSSSTNKSREPISVIGRLRPLTRACELVEKGIREVSLACCEILSWRGEQQLKREGLRSGVEYTSKTVDSTLEGAFRMLDPLSGGFIVRHLMIGTENGWTAYFNNSVLLAADSSISGDLSGKLKVRAVHVVNQDECIHKTSSRHWTGEYGQFRFWVFHNGGLVRAIDNVHGDDGWEFSQEGKPFPFEDVKKYRLPKKPDRFTGEMLENYLQQLGLRPFEDSFYVINKKRPAVLIERIDQNKVFRDRIVYRSFEEVRDFKWTEDND